MQSQYSDFVIDSGQFQMYLRTKLLPR